MNKALSVAIMAMESLKRYKEERCVEQDDQCMKPGKERRDVRKPSDFLSHSVCGAPVRFIVVFQFLFPE